jgi:hypothetical protein
MRTRFLGIGFLVVAVAATMACGASSTAVTPTAQTPASTQGSSTGTGADTSGTVAATIPADAVRVEGVIRAIRGTCPELGLNVNGRIIVTGARTAFEGKTCKDLGVRDPVVVIVHKVPERMPMALKVLSRTRSGA